MNKKEKAKLEESLKEQKTHILLPMNMGEVDIFYSKKLSDDSVILVHKNKSYLFQLDQEKDNAIENREVQKSNL